MEQEQIETRLFDVNNTSLATRASLRMSLIPTRLESPPPYWPSEASVKLALKRLSKYNADSPDGIMGCDASIQAVEYTQDFGALLNEVERLASSEGLDSDTIRIDWKAPTARLYLPSSLRGALFDLLLYSTVRLPAKALNVKGSHLFPLFDGKGVRQPCLSLYNQRALFPTQPVVVLEMSVSTAKDAKVKCEELKELVLGWIGGLDGVMVVLTFEIVLHESMHLSRLRIHKWSVVDAGEALLGPTFSYTTTPEEGRYRYYQEDGYIDIESEEIVEFEESGREDPAALSGGIQLTALDLGFD